MQTYRFFVNKIAENSALIQGEDFNHITSVLRLDKGDSINVFNYEHGEFRAVISAIDKRERTISLTVGEKVREREQNRVKIAAAIALIKKENMELILEKLTEIGVDEIIPVITKRSVVKIKEEEKKTARWEKIIYEAVKQSGRISAPMLHRTAGSVEELAKNAGEGIKLLVWEKEENNFIIDEAIKAKDAGRVLFFTGPEGGFEQSEAEYLIKGGFIPVSMGDTTLRAETAAILAGGVLIQGLRRGKWKN
jgi:16S rRNA (uracil1498-N3)-methyltransferase